MGKFLKMMSQNDSKTLQARAAVINTQAELQQKNLINALKQKKAEMELKIQSLTDFAPDNTQSLRPGTAGWEPKKWVTDLQNAKVTLAEIELQLKIAEDTYEDFFGEDEAAE
jgi:hypothetical protein